MTVLTVSNTQLSVLQKLVQVLDLRVIYWILHGTVTKSIGFILMFVLSI